MGPSSPLTGGVLDADAWRDMNPVQKVAFAKLAKASVARHDGPFAEFVPVDVRPIQQLNDIVTVSFGAPLFRTVRKAQLMNMQKHGPLRYCIAAR